MDVRVSPSLSDERPRSRKSFDRRVRSMTLMRLVLLGPPGAGKGTQAAKLSAHLGVPRISTGDILRHSVAEGTELGKKAKAYMDSGKLVPDELVIAMTERRLKEKDAQKGFILDGFPRTIAQAEALSKLTDLDAAVNLFLEPPERAGVCDRCRTPLVIRADDREDVVRKRIESYEKQTAPLIKYCRDRGLLKEVYATGLIEEIFLRTIEALKT